jgi:hypothetical protein
MRNRKCLIIDNDDQTDEIERIIRLGKQKGLNIECHQFNVGSPLRDDLLTDNKIDIEKVVSVYKRDYKKNAYHLVAFDWGLTEGLDGIELIRQFEHHRCISDSMKMLYSGLLKSIIYTMIDDYEISKDKEPLYKKINTLIKVDIKDFSERETYDETIVTVLDKSDERLEIILKQELLKYKDLTFKSGYTPFKGNTLEEIVDKMDTPLGETYKRDLLENAIAHMIELNSED